MRPPLARVLSFPGVRLFYDLVDRDTSGPWFIIIDVRYYYGYRFIARCFRLRRLCLAVGGNFCSVKFAVVEFQTSTELIGEGSSEMSEDFC